MIIFVLGMHRSGTSMISGILSICGAWLGKPKDILMNGKDNPKGHFENKPFMHLNRQILRANNGRWDSPPANVEFAGYKNKMKMFLLNLPDNSITALKDPRTALTLHLWKQLIHSKNMKFVYIQRNHSAVAESLRKRNGINIQKGTTLSKYYNKQIEKNLILFPFSEIYKCNYSDFFTNYWELLVEELCRFTGLSEPEQKTWDKLNKFIDPKLRHWK